MKCDLELREEFEHINNVIPMGAYGDPFDLLVKYPSAMSDQNYSKNRYRDVLPEECSRVKLNSLVESSDYINASHICVYKQKYIGCQAPLPCTFAAFWCMVWEQSSAVITMLTKTIEGERRKADVYWPDQEGETLIYGNFAVSLSSVKKLQLIVVRTFTLRKLDTKEERQVVHLHYTEWPDFGVPNTTHKIRELIQLVSFYQDEGESKGLKGPLIAHCSAGIGRVGTFFAILTALEKMKDGVAYENVNVQDIVIQMRKSRPGMVQTDKQYIFVHQVVEDLAKEKHFKVSAKKINTSWRYLSIGVTSSDSSDSEDFFAEEEEDEDEEFSEYKRRYSFGTDLTNSSFSVLSCQQ